MSLLDEDDSLFDSSVHQSCSSSKYNGNKENMSMDKEKVPVLSTEPISLKRKKKGGGYDLRKSIAWDRAFFTEDGILDPVELSVISGTCINPGGQPLSVITEVGNNFKRGDSQNIISSPSSQSQQRKQASPKLLTSHCASGSGAKSSGCPRPSPTSSLKRPAFVNISRSSAKEPKFSKMAIPKPNMCSIPRSAKSSLSVGIQLQHNQFVQSAANNQTCTSSSKIPTIKNSPQVEAGSAASPSTSSSKLLKENSTQATTALPLHPSTRICRPPVSKASNSFLKKTSREVDALGISRTKGDKSVVIAPVPQKTTAGKNLHHTQLQANKPSGLRMPSPSLGFFGQSKVSVSNQPTQMTVKPNIPGLSNLHNHRKTGILQDKKSSSCSIPLSSTKEILALSDSDGVLIETSESVLEKNVNKSVDADVSCDELSICGADAIDKLIKVHALNETGKQFILKGDSECGISETVLKQNMNKLEHGEISYDELPVHGANAVNKSDNGHTQHETTERVILKGDSEPELPMESCHQSLDQGDVTNYSAPEVLDCDRKSSVIEVSEDNTRRCVEVLDISGDMKCRTSDSCDSELERSCFLSRGKYKDCSTDAGSTTEVDDKTYFGEGQSHASNGMCGTDCPDNHRDVKSVATDLVECPEKHLEKLKNHIAVEESSHCNLELCATGDLLPDREPRQDKVELPSSTALEECDDQCESTSSTKRFSLRGQMARENFRSGQHNYDGVKKNVLEDEDNAEILYKVDTFASEELTHNSASISFEKIKNSEKDLDKNDLQIILPKDLTPFSEEWLAAIEAAGEDVLTLKTGAVQNSPPAKSLPEPSPWSPVKRKTNQLGPYDCTKYTTPVPSDSNH